MGRQRQRPASDPGAVPASGLELHALGDGHAEQHDVDGGQLGTRGQFAELPAPAAEPVPRERGRQRLAAPVPGRRAVRLRAVFIFRGGRTGNAGQYQTDRGPFTNENVTHDVIANITKVWGSHASKAGFYYQNSFKPQSIFASFNSQIDFTDSGSNPFDTGYSYANAATGVFNSYTQASKYALPEWRYHNFEWYAQDNWKPSSRFTLDYGLRFYYLSPQWDTTLQASNFLPDAFNPADAASLFTPVCIGASPCTDANRRGMDPALISAGQTPTLANTVDPRFIGRLTPGSDRFNGAFQAGQGINDQLQNGNAFRVSPRIGAVYDLTGKGETIVRGGFGIFYDRPQGNMVFDMISNAPGVLNSTLTWGQLQSLTAAGGDPDPTLGMSPTAFDFKPPRVTQWNVGIQHKVWKEVIVDLAYVGSKSTDLLRTVQINSLPFGATFQPQNQDPTRSASSQLGSSALPDDLLRPYQGYNAIRHVGLQRLRQLQRPADVGDPPVRQRVHVLGLLGVEQGARHQRRRLLRRRAQPEQGRDETPRLLLAQLRPARTTSSSTRSTS